MRKQKFYRRWKRRFLGALGDSQKLLKNCLRTGDPEMVHDLRVTLRRARTLALVGTPVLGKTQATHFRQWALKVATALELAKTQERRWLKRAEDHLKVFVSQSQQLTPARGWTK